MIDTSHVWETKYPWGWFMALDALGNYLPQENQHPHHHEDFFQMKPYEPTLSHKFNISFFTILNMIKPQSHEIPVTPMKSQCVAQPHGNCTEFKNHHEELHRAPTFMLIGLVLLTSKRSFI